jgi:hypothetical protein
MRPPNADTGVSMHGNLNYRLMMGMLVPPVLARGSRSAYPEGATGFLMRSSPFDHVTHSLLVAAGPAAAIDCAQ